VSKPKDVEMGRPPLHVEIEGCGYRPCRRSNWHKNRTQNLVLPFAAPFFITSVKSDRYGGSVGEPNSILRLPTRGD
jgi:hypothetical protein